MAKKSFKEVNPAMQFISSAQQDAAPDQAQAFPAPAGKPETERKSKRLNLLLKPSVLEDISKIAQMKRTSVNDLINTALAEYAQEEHALVEKYDDVFGE